MVSVQVGNGFECCRITKSAEKGKGLGRCFCGYAANADPCIWSRERELDGSRIFAQCYMWRLKTFRVLFCDSVWFLSTLSQLLRQLLLGN